MASGLEGVADLTAQLNDLGAKVAAKELRGTVGAAMEIAEHDARSRIPQGEEPHKTYRGRLVSGGFAVSTLHIETKLDKRTGSAIATLGVGREAFYAVQFIELGTSKMAAHPWLRPSFEESQEPMLQAIADELKKRVEDVRQRRSRGGR